MFAFLLTFAAVGQALIGVAATTEGFTEIKIGSSLHADSPSGPTSWPSPSGRFAFGFYKGQGGFSIGIIMHASEPLVIWTAEGDFGSNTFSKASVLYLTHQGLFLTPNNGSKPIYLINSTESTGAAMLDSGNFIVYYSNPSNHAENCSSPWRGVYCITWQSFDYPTDTMMEGQVLPLGKGLTSRENAVDHSFYMLQMQNDSNLVLYLAKHITMHGNTTTDQSAIWALMTEGQGYTQLIFTERGHLFLSVPDLGTSVQNISLYYPNERQANTLYYATLTPTKYFQLFALNLSSNNSTVVYEIPTNANDCDVKTPCGMNSYCLVINNRTDCNCLPGFNFTDFRDRAKGCKRSIDEPSCWPPGSADTTAFSMEPVENLQWFDEAYSVFSAQSKEDCSSSCLAECDCEAALFFNQNCEKHKLPMSRAKSSNFTIVVSTAYIKVSAGDSGRKAVEKPKRRVFLVAVLLCGAINAAVFLAVLVAGIGSYWFFYGRYRLQWHKWDLAFQEEVAPRSFSFQELAKATNSFSTELGKGGHATVFKGYLRMYGRPNPVPVAVKRLSAEEGKAEVDFQAEIRIIGRAHHVNLVRLLGFCYEESKRLLIYEYMSRGSLGDLIWRTGAPNWKQQTGILLGVARGINYLHRECETQIIHRDIKPENILIAENLSVKISDFGISKLSVGGLQAMSTKRTTTAPGTPGYMAPECAQSKGQNVTEKADVYSFGIVVLETVFWERNTEDNNLLDSASKYLKDIGVSRRNQVELTDAELEKEMMVMLGLLCVQQNPDARPHMEEVILSMVEGVLTVPSVAAAVIAQIISSGKKISWAPSLEIIQDV